MPNQSPNSVDLSFHQQTITGHQVTNPNPLFDSLHKGPLFEQPLTQSCLFALVTIGVIGVVAGLWYWRCSQSEPIVPQPNLALPTTVSESYTAYLTELISSIKTHESTSSVSCYHPDAVQNLLKLQDQCKAFSNLSHLELSGNMQYPANNISSALLDLLSTSDPIAVSAALRAVTENRFTHMDQDVAFPARSNSASVIGDVLTRVFE
jgi:hypothetical protein